MSTAIMFLSPIINLLLYNIVPLFAVQCHVKKDSQYGFVLMSSAYKTLKEQNLGSCYRKCLDDKKCSSINFKLVDGHCEHSRVTRSAFPSRYVQQDGTVYIEARDPDYGISQHLAVSSCKRIYELNTRALSGVYWIQLDSQSSPFKVYCDMETDGGGWTLVYSYRFLRFNNFSSERNAVNPIPSWFLDPSAYYTSPKSVSNTVPLNETSYAAMNFSLWKDIGNEFLFKSNVLHWFSCKPVNGDLVNMKFGKISCKIVKNVAIVCLNSVPNKLRLRGAGPALYKGAQYILFEGSTTARWPIHDPCGKKAQNHVTNVAVPFGTLYIK